MAARRKIVRQLEVRRIGRFAPKSDRTGAPRLMESDKSEV